MLIGISQLYWAKSFLMVKRGAASGAPCRGGSTHLTRRSARMGPPGDNILKAEAKSG